MSIPIPKEANRRIVEGMPNFAIVCETDADIVVAMLKAQLLEGDWLVEFSSDGTSTDYFVMNGVYGTEEAIRKIEVFMKEVSNFDDYNEWWIGFIPLLDWAHTPDEHEGEFPEKLTVYTYEVWDEELQRWCVSNFNWTTGEALAKRLTAVSLEGRNIISKVMLRKDLVERPMQPFVSDHVRKAFGIAPYRYWKKQKGD